MRRLSSAALLSVVTSFPARAAVVLPTYAASSGLQSALERKGHQVTQLLSLGVAILSIIGILVGAAHFALGRGDRGRSYLAGGVIALLLASSAYAIVALFAHA